MDRAAHSLVQRHQRITVVAVVVAVVACGAREPGRGQKPPTQGKEAQPASQPRAKSIYLTLDSIPQGARDALAVQAPDFVPWSADSYRPADRESTRLSRDEGLSLVRAKFRAPNAVDYIVAGYDRGMRGRRSLRIVALLAEPAAAYKVITVSEGPEVPDSLAAKPSRYLAIDTTAVAGKVDLLVVPLPRVAGPPMNTDRYTWVPARSEFLIVTPG